MIDWLSSPFELGFMQRALIAGALAAVVTAVAGTWVVLRGLSFLGDALAHGILPGVALALLLGIDPMAGAVVSAMAMIAGINLIHRRSRLTEDTGIGLLFVGMLAVGVMLISRTGAYAGDLTGILFGDALAVSETDIWILGVTALVVLALNFAFNRSFLVLAFNQQKAEVLGLRPGVAHLLMLAMVTMAVVASFRTVGTLLVFGLLMAPAATATLLVRRVPAVMGMAVLLGIGAVISGLVISLYSGTAASATMAATSVGIFFVVLIVRGFVRPN